MLKLTLDNFAQEVKQSGRTVLVDFWAPWCGYCTMLEPVLQDAAGDWQAAGRDVVVGKVNTDEEPELAAAYDVDTLPTLLLFRDGQPVARQIGFVPKPVLSKMLD